MIAYGRGKEMSSRAAQAAASSSCDNHRVALPLTVRLPWVCCGGAIAGKERGSHVEANSVLASGVRGLIGQPLRVRLNAIDGRNKRRSLPSVTKNQLNAMINQ